MKRSLDWEIELINLTMNHVSANSHQIRWEKCLSRKKRLPCSADFVQPEMLERWRTLWWTVNLETLIILIVLAGKEGASRERLQLLVFRGETWDLNLIVVYYLLWWEKAIVQQKREKGSEADKATGVRRKIGEIEIKTTPGEFRKTKMWSNVKSETDSILL